MTSKKFWQFTLGRYLFIMKNNSTFHQQNTNACVCYTMLIIKCMYILHNATGYASVSKLYILLHIRLCNMPA